MTDVIESTETTEYVERAAVSVTPGDGRLIDVRLVAWGDIATDASGYRETIMRGAFAGVDPADVILESGASLLNGGHDTRAVGNAVAIEEREDGAYGTFHVRETPAGDELLQLVRPGPNGALPVLRRASVVFKPVKSRQRSDGVIERHAVDLARLSILPRGGYPSARVLAVRSEPTTMEVPEVDIAPVDLAPTIARVDNVEAAIARMEANFATPATAARQFESFNAFVEAIQRGDASPYIMRTVADQITSQNDGVNGNSWITDVKRIVNLGRRAITAMGGPGALPDSGMTISYPYYGSANTLVAVQSTQKTEIQSARVDIAAGTAAVATYAGGSDISRQLLDRSSPSYLEAYRRIMLAAGASVTDNAFVNALEAASGTTTQTMANTLGTGMALATSAFADDIFDTTPDHGFAVGDAVTFSTLTGGDATTAALVGKVSWVVATSLGAKTFRVAATPGGTPITWGTADLTAGTVHKINTTAVNLRSSLFQASIAVEAATGSPASVVLASTDVFTYLGSVSDIVPSYPGNPSNASGVGDASTLQLNISGLNIVHSSAVDAGKLVITNPSAAEWLEDGPKWITDDEVMLLGQNVAVYSYAAPAIYVPAGIVELTYV